MAYIPCCRYVAYGLENQKKINRMGKGFQKILKLYGEMKVTDSKGNSVTHVWDYANDKPRIKSEMTKDELAASEKAKWMQLRR